jgi:prevent-host-death family protein
MSTVSVHEAKTHLSRLLQQVEAGEEVVITRGGVPVACLVAVGPKLPREAGRLRHAIEIREDFEAPLPESFWTGEG